MELILESRQIPSSALIIVDLTSGLDSSVVTPRNGNYFISKLEFLASICISSQLVL